MKEEKTEDSKSEFFPYQRHNKVVEIVEGNDNPTLTETS